MMLKADVKSKITYYLSDGTVEVEYCDYEPFNCSELLQNQSYRRRIIRPMEGDAVAFRVISLDHVMKYEVVPFVFPSDPPPPEEPPTEGGTV